jgi:RNA recognition motif-containing protein
MLSTTEQTIWKAMESVRGPECLERVKKLRDFAFVHFSDRKSAEAAMEHWNSKYTISLIFNSDRMFHSSGYGQTYSISQQSLPIFVIAISGSICSSVCH